MKKKFLTGSAILLPLLLTLGVLSFIINFVTEPFQGTVESLISNYNETSGTFLFLKSPEALRHFSKGITLIIILSLVFFIGLLGRFFIVNYILKFGNSFLLSVPYLNHLYATCQEVVNSLLLNSKESYSNVALVPFPLETSLTIGLLTKEAIDLHSKGDSSTIIPVFVPGTPNPSAGYIQMFQKKEIILTDMTVSDGMKYIVSLGTANQEFMLKR